MIIDKTALPKFIADYYNIDIEVILSQTRKQSIVEVRHIIIYVLNKDYGLTPDEICDLLNRTSRSTVYNAVERISYDLVKNKVLKIDLIILRKYLHDPSLFRKKTTLSKNGDTKRFKKKIVQLSQEGVHIATFDTVLQGSIATRISVSSIYRSINSYRRLAKGFYWKKR